jgi:hypothetical protein
VEHQVLQELQVQVEQAVVQEHQVRVVLQEHQVVLVQVEHQVLVVLQEHQVQVVRAVLMVFQVVLFITLTNQ